MKKILSVILAISILMSMAIFPAAAEEEGYVRTFDELLCYEFEKVPASSGWSYFGIPGHKYFGNSYCFNAYPASNPVMEVTDKFETGDPGLLVKATSNGANISYSTLRNDHTSNDERNSEKGQEFLSGDFAISFQAATTQYTSVSLNIYGYDANGAKGANVILNKVTPDGEKIISEKLTDYKIVFDKDTNSYEVYVDNRFYKEGKITYTNNLYTFNLVAYVDGAKANNAGVDAYAFLNDFALYIISDDDTESQYYVEDGENGKIDVSYGVQQAGNEYSYTVTPNEGYAVTKVTVGGEVQEGIAPEGGTYTFTANPGDNNVISAEYGSYSYTVEESAGGTIVINDDITGVGQEVSYTITPNEGYTVKSVTIGGEIQEGIAPEGGTYTFITKIGENNVISAEYNENRKFEKVVGEEFGSKFNASGWTHKEKTLAVNKFTGTAFSANTSKYSDQTVTDKFNTGDNGILFTPNTTNESKIITSLFALHGQVDSNNGFQYNKATHTPEGIEARNGHTALTFRAAMSEYVQLSIKANGFRTTTDFSNGIPTSGYGTTYILDSSYTGNNATFYKHVLDDDSYDGWNTFGCITRDKLVDYKIIFDNKNYTYDVYVDNKPVSLGRQLLAPLYLCTYRIDFTINAQAAAENNIEPYAFVDDVALYTLTDADISAQYIAEESVGGKITINNDITAAGKEASFTITPNEGYTVKSVTVGGVKVEGVAPEGGTYTFTAAPGENNVISAEYDTYRILKKEFELDFENLSEGSWIGGKGSVKSFAKCETNDVSYGNYYSFSNASGEILSESGNKLLKINLPKVNEEYTAKSSSKINFLWANNDVFGSFTKEPFAISFKLGLEEGVTAQLEADDRGPDKIGSGIFSSMNSSLISNFDYKQTAVMEYTDIDTNLDLTGIHEYKYIVDPKDASYDMYVDNNLIAENVHLRSASTLYYFRLVISNAKGENDLTAYLDDFRFYLLTDEYLGVQTDVEANGNGKVISSASEFIKIGSDANYTITPDEGSYIKNVLVNGKPIAAFNSESVEIAFSDITSINSISVEFADYTENAPAIDRALNAARDSEAVYLFFKYNANGVTADEWGIIVSKDIAEPDFANGTVVPAGALSDKGYFGYKLISKEGFYVRGYAKKGEEIYYGEAEWIHPYMISDIVE